MLMSINMLHVIVATLFLSVMGVTATNSASNFYIVSKVNTDVITNFDLEQRELLLSLLNIKPNNDKNMITRQLIDERLQFQFSQTQGVILSRKEIESEVNSFLVKSSLKKGIARQFFINNGLEWSSFQDYIAGRALWKKTLFKLYSNRAKITDYELNSPPKTKLEMATRLLKLSEIVIPFSERGEEKAILLANRLHLELSVGGDFRNAAKRFSRSQTGSSGGEIGYIDTRKLPRTIKSSLSDLSVNQVSKPIVLGKSVVLFKVTDLLNKTNETLLDYVMTFVTGSNETMEGVPACNDTLKGIKKSVLLSKLNEETSQVLRRSELLELVDLQDNSWVMLCDRRIEGNANQINQKKAIHFNNQMIMFSRDLMLKLYRKAIIN